MKITFPSSAFVIEGIRAVFRHFTLELLFSILGVILYGESDELEGVGVSGILEPTRLFCPPVVVCPWPLMGPPELPFAWLGPFLSVFIGADAFQLGFTTIGSF